MDWSSIFEMFKKAITQVIPVDFGDGNENEVLFFLLFFLKKDWWPFTEYAHGQIRSMIHELK